MKNWWVILSVTGQSSTPLFFKRTGPTLSYRCTYVFIIVIWVRCSPVCRCTRTICQSFMGLRDFAGGLKGRRGTLLISMEIWWIPCYSFVHCVRILQPELCQTLTCIHHLRSTAKSLWDLPYTSKENQSKKTHHQGDFKIIERAAHTKSGIFLCPENTHNDGLKTPQKRIQTYVQMLYIFAVVQVIIMNVGTKKFWVCGGREYGWILAFPLTQEDNQEQALVAYFGSVPAMQ